MPLVNFFQKLQKLVYNGVMSLKRESWQAFQAAARQYQTVWNQQLKEIGLQDRSAQILLALGEEPQLVGTLATMFECGTSNITGVVERLEHTGLVYRFECNEDKRKVYVGLTEKGKEKYKLVYKQWDFLPPSWQNMDKEFHSNIKQLMHVFAQDMQQDKKSEKESVKIDS